MWQIIHELQAPTDQRVFAIARMLYAGEMSVDEIHDITKIDRWFLSKLQRIADAGNRVKVIEIRWMMYVFSHDRYRLLVCPLTNL